MAKIGIDARLYGAKHGGIGRYTENLIKQLERLDDANQYFVFLQKDNFDDYQPSHGQWRKILADFQAYGWQEQLLFWSILKKYNLDLVHFTHFNAPFFYRRKFIVTIHDLIISHYPDSRATTLNPLLYKVKLFFYKVIINSTARRAQKIIAVSAYTKNDIVKLLKVETSKISVTYEGVDLPQTGEVNCQKLQADLNIRRDYLLYVGSAYPHKNLERLIDAFDKLGRNIQLVLVGKKNYFYQRLERKISDRGLTAEIILTDYVNDKQLACLYQNAKLYVFPSLIEGFGLPPLEAQSYDLPVVSSRGACLPEILGDSAVYFDPENIDDMAGKISQLLDHKALAADLIIKGRENLKKYSWVKCASRTLDLYRHELGPID